MYTTASVLIKYALTALIEKPSYNRAENLNPKKGICNLVGGMQKLNTVKKFRRPVQRSTE